MKNEWAVQVYWASCLVNHMKYTQRILVPKGILDLYLINMRCILKFSDLPWPLILTFVYFNIRFLNKCLGCLYQWELDDVSQMPSGEQVWQHVMTRWNTSYQTTRKCQNAKYQRWDKVWKQVDSFYFVLAGFLFLLIFRNGQENKYDAVFEIRKDFFKNMYVFVSFRP